MEQFGTQIRGKKSRTGMIGKGQEVAGFLAGNPLVSVQIRSSFGTHRITAENSQEKAVTAQGSQAKSLSQNFPVKDRSFSRNPVLIRRPERIIKGSIEGRRVLNQSISPVFAYSAAVFGKQRRKRRKQVKER